ncbi:DUF3298 domain-containing protein [Candidatus Dojkabacteria bacterium]|nr:DUF3298 domain-containing protein [Candidatus Dojkabacteria bacterium]
MDKKKILIIVAVLVAVLLLISCSCSGILIWKWNDLKDWVESLSEKSEDNNSQTEENDDEEDAEEDDDNLVYGTYEIVVDSTYEDEDEWDDVNFCTMENEIPELTLLLDGGEVSSDNIDDINQEFEALFTAEGFCEDVLDSNSDYPSGDLYFEGYYEIGLNQYPFVSIVYYSSSYTGGAHGSNIAKAATFNVLTGNRLNLSDLFTDDGSNDWEEVLWTGVKTVTLDEWEGYLYEDTFSGQTEPPSGQIWYLTDEYIGFIWNEYDIAPYAAGMIYVEIPFDADFLEDIIKSGGPIGVLVE